MGSSTGEIEEATKEYPAGGNVFKLEWPQHKVAISKPFAVGRTHITRGEFATFVKATGRTTGDDCSSPYGMWDDKESKFFGSWRSPGFEQTDRHPAVCVNWYDANAYVDWLNKVTGQSYRLLSEAETEYVTRATASAMPQPKFFFGNDMKDLCAYANGADRTAATLFRDSQFLAPCDDGYLYTAPAASFKANAWGLYDVHGNAWIWTADSWNDSHEGAPSDGTPRTIGNSELEKNLGPMRVVRGGAFNIHPQLLRAAYRNGFLAGVRYFNLGFRVARTL